ncbi:hypothetical protein FGG08_000333 [Glutinoglossum americanum]|uniref:Arrestin C-terminal-like domain-containing protein n=1 Tax=Glutinoglossum americanum TaxID=1670608 RepID=A0A9P8L678_9PEZI|nr:hypothetical protein FGG08_000333 [Glutinoglossum americanum]
MPDSIVYVYSSRGSISYVPRGRASSTCLTHSHFRGRARRSGTIRITRYPSPDRRVTRSLLKKLASKENAKRFLRSFTLSPASPSTPAAPASPPAQPTDPGVIQSSPSVPPRHHGMSLDPGGASTPPQRQSLSTNTLANDGTSRRHLSSTSTLVSGGGSQPSSRNASRAASPSPANRTEICEDVQPPPLTNEKPIASANSLSVSISLAEPMLFLHGFEPNDINDRAPAMLRGSMILRVTKSTKIKSIYLHFTGKSRTEWPEGIPPKRIDFYEERTIMHRVWTLFDAKFDAANSGPCADYTRMHKQSSKPWDPLVPPPPFSSTLSSWVGSANNEQKRLSLQLNQSRSFGKGESATSQAVTLKGYRTFHPGDYVYNFELPLDSHLPETIDVELGSVKYNLEACIERAGAFRQNLSGSKEIIVIRAPAENSLEQVEPIAISRNWEDQLHYDIVISGKSFPLGSQIPIAFKLTPLAKVQCHRIKVLVTENIEYWANNRRVHRLEPNKKIPLLEKRSDAPTSSAYPGSTIRILSGGGVDFDSRAAAAAGNENVPTDDGNNLLGNLDGEHNVGPTEMEFSVQLPSCTDMKERKEKLHFDTTFHDIQIILRLSRPDQNDPSRRRHFEISIDSPFHILSCQATARNIALPAYTTGPPNSDGNYACGCPDAPRHTPSSQDENSRLAQHPEAHTPPAHVVQRPIHMLRAPSFNPPAFDDDIPPPLVTPPPHYESIVSTQNPLADYFSRRRELELHDEVDEMGMASPRSRVDLPLNPGGRVNRSMDEQRTWAPIGD